jgi:hypothetical protein
MRLNWDQASRAYESGLDRGVLYFGAAAVPWNGLISVEADDTGEVFDEYYIDGVRYVVVQSEGDFGAKVSCFTYPDELDSIAGPFGFTYRVQVGEYHQIHLVYNAYGRMQAQSWSTLSDRQTTSDINWDI